MRPLQVSLLGLLVCTPAAAGEVKGDFIGPGVYAMQGRCEKLEALAKGGPKNVETVPETLSVNGFEGWEGACTFRSITEIEKGKKWQASMDCHEGGEEGPESDIFERLQDGSLKVTVMGKSSIFVRCDKDKGN